MQMTRVEYLKSEKRKIHEVKQKIIHLLRGFTIVLQRWDPIRWLGIVIVVVVVVVAAVVIVVVFLMVGHSHTRSPLVKLSFQFFFQRSIPAFVSKSEMKRKILSAFNGLESDKLSK